MMDTEAMSPLWRAITPVSSCSTPGPDRATTTIPTGSLIVSRSFQFVLPQQIIPVSLCLEQQFADLADGAMAAFARSDVLNPLFHLRSRVGGRDCKAHPIHDDDIRQVVTHISYLRSGNPRALQYLLDDRDLFDVPLVNVRKIALFGAFFSSGRDAAADQTRYETLPGEPLQGDPVLSIEAFGFDDGAGRTWNAEHPRIGQHPVHVHEKHADVGRQLVHRHALHGNPGPQRDR